MRVLVIFQLVQKDARDKPKFFVPELFNHTCRYRNTNTAVGTKDGKQVHLVPMERLDVVLYEDSLKCIQPTESELHHGAAIRDSFGNRAIKKCA